MVLAPRSAAAALGLAPRSAAAARFVFAARAAAAVCLSIGVRRARLLCCFALCHPAGGDRGRPHAPLLLTQARRRLLRRLRCAPLAPCLHDALPRGHRASSAPRLGLQLARAPAPAPTLCFSAGSFTCTVLFCLPVPLQRHWLRRRWGWRATPSCMWETTFVSGQADNHFSQQWPTGQGLRPRSVFVQPPFAMPVCALDLRAVRTVAMRAPPLSQLIPCPLLQTRTPRWPR